RSLGQPVYIAYASSENEFGAAFAALVRQGVRALLLGTDTIFFNHRDQLIALAASHRIPAIYTFREYVRDGGLYQSSVNLTRLVFPNQLQNDSRWRTEGRLPWGLPLQC